MKNKTRNNNKSNHYYKERKQKQMKIGQHEILQSFIKDIKHQFDYLCRSYTFRIKFITFFYEFLYRIVIFQHANSKLLNQKKKKLM